MELRKKTIIACYSDASIERMKTILAEYQIKFLPLKNFSETKKMDKNTVGVAKFMVKHGFVAPDLLVISEQDIFGEKVIKFNNNRDNRSLEKILKEQTSINEGDIVVHRDHGIGRFVELQTIETNGLKNDFLKINYADNSSLFVPIEDFDLVSRYGEYSLDVKLDKLGSERWNNKRDAVKKKLQLIARELIRIASLRKLMNAPIFFPNENEYQEFSSLFKYVETQDQERAIDDVKQDFLSGKPVDRLICGDVGFGKTEVALRAAFMVANSERNPSQVAIVVPTTLLCRQHYNVFKERFKYSGLNIASLSRLTKAVDNKRVINGLANGKIDIVIGTHALLGDNIKFKNLGLLIVDEEQRFGVKQKEKLKEIGGNIHVVTLSATPIPRTLQMAMTGIKKLSLITTPPIDRLSIDTHVMNFDELIIREAIHREIRRGGKVIIVVPRIMDITLLEMKLKDTLLTIKYQIAHGQMSPSELDKKINDFYDNKFQILISTTIIENGLDIPNANTIIIYKADKFGLSQLHQLRGRVGRSKEKAYAYLTIDPNDNISENAKKRLRAIERIQEIGGGFSIASNDMDIRGSGNIVGEEQSGHIREIGIELYNQLLVEAVRQVKNEDSIEIERDYDYSPQIKLNISTSIDKSYIEDINLRLSYYRKISDIENDEQEDNLKKEMENRFGKLPVEVLNILEISKIKSICKKLNISKLEHREGFIYISFYNNKFKNPDALIKMIQDSKGKVKMGGQNIVGFYSRGVEVFKDVYLTLKSLENISEISTV